MNKKGNLSLKQMKAIKEDPQQIYLSPRVMINVNQNPSRKSSKQLSRRQSKKSYSQQNSFLAIQTNDLDTSIPLKPSLKLKKTFSMKSQVKIPRQGANPNDKSCQLNLNNAS